MARPNKKEKLILFNQTEILSAADELFRLKGVTATTMDHIAQAANCSKSTIYAYFKSKDDIFYHLLYGEMCKLKRALGQLASDSNDFEDFFFQVCYYFVEMYDQAPVYFDGLAGNIQIEGEDFSYDDILKNIYEVGEQINDILIAQIAQAIGAGIVNPDIEPVETVIILCASLCGIIASASAKTSYIALRMGKTREEFMQYGFSMLLQSLKKTS